MQELETRIIKIDVANIRKMLINNHAKKVKEENQINDIYYIQIKKNYRFNRGSNASRKPSPSRLKPSTVRINANPGKRKRWVACTTSGVNAFGMTCEKRMRMAGVPIERSAVI